MADDWIKMRHCLAQHPKVFRLSRSLGVPVAHAVGCLYMVWAWADQHTEGETLEGVGVGDLDAVCGVDGFGEAMAQVGWAEAVGDALHLPRYHEHNGRTAKKRAADARRASRKRRTACDKSPPNVASEATKTRPREEKRREEENREECVHTAREDSATGLGEAHPVTVATARLAEVMGMSACSTGGAGRAIGLEAQRCRVGEHDPVDVLTAAIDVACAMREREGGGWGVGKMRDVVLAQIRKAAEAGELPEVYARGERAAGAEATKRIEVQW